jgi:hypothetical protein
LIKDFEMMIHNYNELRLISDLISSSGGKGSDDDDVLSTDINCLSTIIIKLKE